MQPLSRYLCVAAAIAIAGLGACRVPDVGVRDDVRLDSTGAGDEAMHSGPISLFGGTWRCRSG